MFNKRLSMSCGYNMVPPEVQFNVSDLAEVVKKQGLDMPNERMEPLLTRYKNEIEIAAQNAMVATAINLLANPHVANVFEVKEAKKASSESH